jgi:hypothetical protein
MPGTKKPHTQTSVPLTTWRLRRNRWVPTVDCSTRGSTPPSLHVSENLGGWVLYPHWIEKCLISHTLQEPLGGWALYPHWIAQCLISHTVQESWGISFTPENPYFWDTNVAFPPLTSSLASVSQIRRRRSTTNERLQVAECLDHEYSLEY